MRAAYPAILALPLLLSLPFQARADEVFYCYGEHYGSFNNLQPAQTILISEAPPNTRPYKFYDYSFGINLTKKQIGYSLDNVTGRREEGEESKTSPERWVDAKNVQEDKNRWILELPVMILSEREHAIERVFFDQDRLYFTRIWYEIFNVSSIILSHDYGIDYAEILSPYNSTLNASKRDPISSFTTVTAGRCKKL